MLILKRAAEVRFTFGPVPLKIFSQNPDVPFLNPEDHSLEMLIDELRRRQYRLVEAQKYSATPALTGTVAFLFRSKEEAEADICTCDAGLILRLLRGNMGEPWTIQMAFLPIERDGSPTGREVLTIHLMPNPEDRTSG